MESPEDGTDRVPKSKQLSLWLRRNRDDYLRDGIVAGVCGVILLLVAVHFDDRREERAELRENTAFVRQAVMDPNVKLKPFRRMNLKGAKLGGLPLGCPAGVKPQRIDQGCADLREADLRGADLSQADLRGADLSFAAMIGANLRDADLRGANLRNANLENADLAGANLNGAQLVDAHLDGSCFDQKTVWPLVPPQLPEPECYPASAGTTAGGQPGTARPVPLA